MLVAPAEQALVVHVGRQPGNDATGACVELQAPCASSDGNRVLVSDGAKRLAVTAHLFAEADGRQRLVAEWAGVALQLKPESRNLASLAQQRAQVGHWPQVLKLVGIDD